MYFITQGAPFFHSAPKEIYLSQDAIIADRFTSNNDNTVLGMDKQTAFVSILFPRPKKKKEDN